MILLILFFKNNFMFESCNIIINTNFNFIKKFLFVINNVCFIFFVLYSNVIAFNNVTNFNFFKMLLLLVLLLFRFFSKLLFLLKIYTFLIGIFNLILIFNFTIIIVFL